MKFTEDRSFRKKFYPKAASLVFKTSGTTVGYMSESKNNWKDCVFPDIEHYGIKFYISNMQDQVGFGCNIRFQFKYYLAFRNIR